MLNRIEKPVGSQAAFLFFGLLTLEVLWVNLGLFLDCRHRVAGHVRTLQVV
jgi:hypothetical protein